MSQAQKPFYFAIGVIIAVGGLFIFLKSQKTPPVVIPANVAIAPADTSGFRGYFLGDSLAPVEVTEYADFQCAGCQQFAVTQFPDVEQRLVKSGKIRLRFRDFPLDERHTNPRPAAHSAACANDQGKFWEMAHELFARQEKWSPMPNPVSEFQTAAKDIGLDVAVWDTCMASAKYAGRIQASRLEAEKLGIPETPSFVIGGKIYTKLSADFMVKIVDSLIAAKKP